MESDKLIHTIEARNSTYFLYENGEENLEEEKYYVVQEVYYSEAMAIEDCPKWMQEEFRSKIGK
jgi:hypothetical protein